MCILRVRGREALSLKMKTGIYYRKGQLSLGMKCSNILNFKQFFSAILSRSHVQRLRTISALNRTSLVENN